MDKSFPNRNVDNRISFRASANTHAALSKLAKLQGVSLSVVAKRMVDDAVIKSPLQQTLDLVVDRLLVLDELVRIMLSDVEAERLGEAEFFARLRAISIRDGGRHE